MVAEDINRNSVNEFLGGLRNQTVIGDIQNQVIAKSKILPHIKVLEEPGDVLKIVGLKSNRPKQYSWDYKEKEFSPGDTVIHKAEITDKDKLIFYTVFSESIEKIAVGGKIAETVAKQTEQVSYDIANFYDEEFVQNYACDLNRYRKEATFKLNAEQLRDIQLVGEIAITTGYQMTSPSTLFNKREERCNVSETKKILCFVDYSLYGRGKVASIYKSPSPVLDELERIFTVIPCSMVDNVKLSLIDSGAIYLWSVLAQRYLKLDEYVACHKLLDHLWRKWIFVDYRPAFTIIYDENAPDIKSTFLTSKKDNILKDILKDFANLKDKTNIMTDAQAKEWNTAGFNYEKAKEWIDIGLLVSDAGFVNWLVKDKSKEDPSYAKPDWLLDHAGNDPVKSIDELKEEFKAI